ncbi:MAG: hypothetical protein FWG35_07830 [Spirochaetaceae bacterium]|nr:hypothetical protein [Spirochaetaceae bacterium]
MQIIQVKTSGASADWDFLDTAYVQELRAMLDKWTAAYEITLSPHTPIQTRERNQVRKEVEKYLRDFINEFVRYNRKITDSERDALGIPYRDLIITTIGGPVSQATADLGFPGVHLVELRKIRPVSGVLDDRSDYGVRIFYGLTGEATEEEAFRLTKPPKSGNDLPKSVFTRRKKYLFDFDGESGNTVYFCLRYENAKGEAGPFGPMLSAIIP